MIFRINKKPSNFLIFLPMILNKFFHWGPISKEDFKFEWSKSKHIYSSELLLSNRKIAKNIEDCQKYFEHLVNLNKQQRTTHFKNKIGGRFFLNFIQNSFLVKIIWIEDRKIIIKVASQNDNEENSEINEHILDTFVYLLCKRKSK